MAWRWSTRRFQLVAGACGRIGLELARCFARGGHSLVVITRSAGRLEAVAVELGRLRAPSATAIAGDFGRRGAAAELAGRPRATCL